MIHSSYRFRFAKNTPRHDIVRAVALTGIAVESIHGRAALRLNGIFGLDPKARIITVGADSQLGYDFARILSGFLTVFVGENGYSVKQVKEDEELS